MNALLIYLLKVIAMQAVLYLIYTVIFHRSGRHAINRFYIILALIISFVIPSLTLPSFQSNEKNIETERPIWYEIAEMTEFSETGAELIPVESLSESDFSLTFIILSTLSVSVFLLLRLIFSHFQLVSLKKQSDRILRDGLFIHCSKIESPFSYFNDIFIPKRVMESSSFDIIISHELVHVKKRHSIDRIVLEIILAIFWFNPFHYLFKNRLIETHEFEADEEVIAVEKDSIRYQEVLYQQIKASYSLATANHFKLNTIKTRIKMINKNKKLPRFSYLFILPAVILMTFSFAHKEKGEFIAPFKSNVSNVLEDVLSSDDRFTPSIFPLKDSDGVKLTASYGMSVHPILKVERMHEGIDLKTYTGNLVLATADGIVVEAGVINPDSWGKSIKIKHGDVYETFYAHLSKVHVTKGDKIARGDIIGKSGTTGFSTGPHLHYEVKETKKGFLDPLDFIKDYDFKKAARLANAETAKLGKTNQKFKVVIDPGHGGNDKGIASSNLTEKEIALKVANEVAYIFKNSDQVEIILTRDEDEIVTLKDRVSKSENADLFISLHTENHEDENEDMMVAIYNDQNRNATSSKNFGQLMKHEYSGINKKFKLGYTDGYYILKNAKAPAILFIMGYFSNSEAEDYLNSDKGIKEIAQELSDAILAAL